MKFYLSHASASALCGVLGMLTFGAVTSAPVGASSSAAAAVTVTMTDNRFTPGTIHVQRGGTVSWRNTSQMSHTVSGKGFDSGTLAPGATFSHTFEQAGTFAYHCKPHQAAGMVGTVIVDP
jgi:plastocyanin